MACCITFVKVRIVIKKDISTGRIAILVSAIRGSDERRRAGRKTRAVPVKKI